MSLLKYLILILVSVQAVQAQSPKPKIDPELMSLRYRSQERALKENELYQRTFNLCSNQGFHKWVQEAFLGKSSKQLIWQLPPTDTLQTFLNYYYYQWNNGFLSIGATRLIDSYHFQHALSDCFPKTDSEWSDYLKRDVFYATFVASDQLFKYLASAAVVYVGSQVAAGAVAEGPMLYFSRIYARALGWGFKGLLAGKLAQKFPQSTVFARSVLNNKFFTSVVGAATAALTYNLGYSDGVSSEKQRVQEEEMAKKTAAINPKLEVEQVISPFRESMNETHRGFIAAFEVYRADYAKQIFELNIQIDKIKDQLKTCATNCAVIEQQKNEFDLKLSKIKEKDKKAEIAIRNSQARLRGE